MCALLEPACICEIEGRALTSVCVFFSVRVVARQSMTVVDHDVMFSVVLVPMGNTPSSPDNVVLLDGVRLKADDNPGVRIPCRGVALLCFDNTYSRLRGKKITYTVQVGGARGARTGAVESGGRRERWAGWTDCGHGPLAAPDKHPGVRAATPGRVCRRGG